MPVVEVPEGSTAATLVHAFVTDGAADDLSSASGSLLFNAKTVDGTAVVTDQAASWFTDGTDGKVQTSMNSTLVDTAPRDLVCDVEVQGYAGGNLVSHLFILRILKRAKGT